MKNRDKYQDKKTILESAKSGAGITKIMFRTFMQYRQTRKSLDELLSEGLIEMDTSLGGKNYRTTPKGLKYLASLYNESNGAKKSLQKIGK